MKYCASIVLVGLLCSGGLVGAEDAKNSRFDNSASGRVVGGFDVNITAYPYTVVVTVSIPNGNLTCGGTIVASNKVLTAAHCLYGLSISSITIRAGSNFRTSGGFLFNHLSYVVHKQFNLTDFTNDVAVITIKGSFDNRTNVRNIILQETEPVISSGDRWENLTACFVVGWGWINLKGQLADRLQRANFVLIPQTTCASRATPLSSTTICAQSLQGDACYGDSGGPLVCNGRLYGVSSFGPTNCNGAIPDGFTKITAPTIRSFIRTNAGV